MSLEHLWAGWRSAYVAGAVAGTGEGPRSAVPSVDAAADCVFCRIVASGPPSPDNGVLWAGPTTVVVLNAYPYASGHLMALPRRHVASLAALTGDEAADLWAAARTGVAALEAAYRPEGVNLGRQPGGGGRGGDPPSPAPARRAPVAGDTNFMTRWPTPGCSPRR